MNPQKDKPTEIPRLTMNDTAMPGLFVKSIKVGGHNMMKTYAHRDDYYIIVFIKNGRASVSVDLKELSLTSGEGMIVSPTQVHYPCDASDDVEGWIVGIAAEHFSERETELTAKYALNLSSVHFDEISSADIQALFEMLTRQSNYQAALNIALAIKSIVLSFIDSDSKDDNQRFTAIVMRLKKLLADKLREEKGPSAYANMLNLSEVYLNEAVKSVTGMSVSAFIRSQVVLEAKRKFLYTSLSAQEIAYWLGYEDYTYFSKLFKKETGIAPTKYRMNLK